MTAPWTPRERSLREALEKARPMMNRIDHNVGAYDKGIAAEGLVDSILADQPPTDPRVEALGLAEQCLSNIKDDLIRSINQTTLCHHRPINDREREAAALCCGEGYGNMMSILSTQWHLSVGGGAFVVGECVTTAQNQVKDIEAALAAIAAAKGEK